MSETLGISELPALSRYVFGQTFPKSRSSGFQSKLANALKTPKCIDFYLMMLEAEGFDGKRVSNGSDRNQNHLWFAIQFA